MKREDVGTFGEGAVERRRGNKAVEITHKDLMEKKKSEMRNKEEKLTGHSVPSCSPFSNTMSIAMQTCPWALAGSSSVPPVLY